MNTVIIKYPGEFETIFTTTSNLSYETQLEMIFAEWNHGSSAESELFKNSKVRSLSVNDFVCINDNWFQCASVGWRPVSKKFVNQIEKEVTEHNLFKKYGGFVTLDRVMRDKKLGLEAKIDDKLVDA